MNSFGLKYNPVTPSRLLMGFLEFYGNFFMPNITGVSVVNEG